MDAVSTAAGRVAQMHASMTAEPPDDVMGAFGREQAALAAEGRHQPQTPDGSLSMQQKHDLGFAVVSDPGNVIAGALGVLTQPSDEARAAQLHLGLDLTTVNADATITLPMPTVVITDTARTLRWIDVRPDDSTRTEPAQILAALDHLSR